MDEGTWVLGIMYLQIVVNRCIVFLCKLYDMIDAIYHYHHYSNLPVLLHEICSGSFYLKTEQGTFKNPSPEIRGGTCFKGKQIFVGFVAIQKVSN